MGDYDAEIWAVSFPLWNDGGISGEDDMAVPTMMRPESDNQYGDSDTDSDGERDGVREGESEGAGDTDSDGEEHHIELAFPQARTDVVLQDILDVHHGRSNRQNSSEATSPWNAEDAYASPEPRRLWPTPTSPCAAISSVNGWASPMPLLMRPSLYFRPLLRPPRGLPTF